MDERRHMNQSMDMLHNLAVEPNNQDQEQAPNNFSIDQLSELANVRFDGSDYILKPASQGEKVLCQVFREDPANGVYNFFLEQGVGNHRVRRFLMSSKRVNNKSNQYIISSEPQESAKMKENIIGKLKANFLGTSFTALDLSKNKGNMSSSSSNVSLDTKPGNAEVVSIIYDPNILGIKGPRKITVVIPGMTPEGKQIVCIPKDNSETILERFKTGDTTSHLVPLINKPPHWNEALQSFTLDFRGRVLLASVKNFQLVHEEDVDYIVMQMGKVYPNLFTVDYQYPLSAMQAFAIALSSFHGKLACE